jgi:hypothetical protein
MKETVMVTERQGPDRSDKGHLRGKDDRSAKDTGRGQPRPDETTAGDPAGIQATHAGRPTRDPSPPDQDDTGVGDESVPTAEHHAAPRSRMQTAGRDTEGAFGEEQPEVDRQGA